MESTLREFGQLLSVTEADPGNWKLLSESKCKRQIRDFANVAKFLDDEWRKRVEVVKTLQELQSKVRLNRLQCKQIIDLYSALEFLKLHPENYLNMLKDGGNFDMHVPFHSEEYIQQVNTAWSKFHPHYSSSLRASFLELSKIMLHGKNLVEECACEDWIHGAILKTTTVPRNEYSIVTPFCLHVQKLEWIMDVIEKIVKELWSIKEFWDYSIQGFRPDNPSKVGLGDAVKNIFKSFSWPTAEIKDRRLLLGALLEFLKEPSPSDKHSQEKLQLAMFVIQKLQMEPSSESRDRGLSPISEDPDTQESAYAQDSQAYESPYVQDPETHQSLDVEDPEKNWYYGSLDVDDPETQDSPNVVDPEAYESLDVQDPETLECLDVEDPETSYESLDVQEPETPYESLDVQEPETQESLDVDDPETQESLDVQDLETQESPNVVDPKTYESLDVQDPETKERLDVQDPETHQSLDVEDPEKNWYYGSLDVDDPETQDSPNVVDPEAYESLDVQDPETLERLDVEDPETSYESLDVQEPETPYESLDVQEPETPYESLDVDDPETLDSPNVVDPEAQERLDVEDPETSHESLDVQEPETQESLDVDDPETQERLDVEDPETSHESLDVQEPETQESLDVDDPETQESLDVQDLETQESPNVVDPKTYESLDVQDPEIKERLDVQDLETQKRLDVEDPEKHESPDVRSSQTHQSLDVPSNSSFKDLPPSEYNPNVSLSSISKDPQPSGSLDVFSSNSIFEGPESLDGLDMHLNSMSEAERFGRNEMVMIGKLGEGSNCIGVYKKNWLGIKVAVKEFELEVWHKIHFDKEVDFAALQHPHIVRVFDHWAGKRLNIVMELMEKDLNSFLKTEFKDDHPPLLWAIDVMHQLAEAMKYLWDNGVMHRDVKSLNILVRRCECNNERCIVIKLADFGESKTNRLGQNFRTLIGTTAWMAPEVSENSETGYTIAADIYSFAITCSEILTGKAPFHHVADSAETVGHKFKQNVKAGLRPKLPKHCPVYLSSYIQRCWAAKPEERPKHFSEICEFLLFCKEVTLRKELQASPLQSINESNAKFLLAHLGINWCLEKNNIPSAVRKCIKDALLHGTKSKELLKDVPEAERVEAAEKFFPSPKVEPAIDQDQDQDYTTNISRGECREFNRRTTSILALLDGQLWILVLIAMATLFSSPNENGTDKGRFIAIFGRMLGLVLFVFISRHGFPFLQLYRPTFLLVGLNYFMARFLVFIAFVAFISIVSKIRITMRLSN